VNPIALLTSFIYLVSSSLFLPVLALLAGATIWIVVYSGGFFGRWLERRRKQGSVADPKPTATVVSFRAELERILAEGGTESRDPLVVNLLRENELRLWKGLDRLKMIIRVGPGLGLIGTLIPMGTGLASLGQGDLASLSGDLVVAFTTTVVGMAVGLAAYCFFTVERRWVEEDLKNMELAAELLAAGHKEA